MGGGGGSQPSSVSQTTIPEYAQPYMENLLGQASAITLGNPVVDDEGKPTGEFETPEQAVYGGQRIADPSQTQLIARQNIRGLDPTTGFTTGMNLTQEGVSGLRDIPTEFTGDTVSQYMSPYMQNVVDIQKRKAFEDAQRTQLDANLGAATQGTLGGSRQALMQGLREGQLREQLGDIQATGQQAAYDSAMAQLERDRAARFSQAQGIAGLGSQIAGLSEADLQSRLGLFGVQEQLGAQERADRQALLTQGYEDFLTEERAPFTRLGYLSDILRGSGNLASTGGTAVYRPAVSPFQDIAQTGINALALYKMSQGGG
tara:strand:- start:162 stop:1109 length:948 start_codon:yes stop_codon:yes gene_type:complete